MNMSQSMIDPTFPLVELHRHLDGNVRLETILSLGQKHNLPLPSKNLEGLRPYIQVTEAKPDILAYFGKFEWLVRVMVDYDAVRQIAYENVEDAKKEGIDYIELRFSPWFMSEKNQLDPIGVVEAVIEGVKIGSRDFGVKTNLIGILSRTYGPDICKKELQALLTHKTEIIALDLAGDEYHYGGELFIEHFHIARDAGWHSNPHAGEVCGPSSIWQAINELGAERIGHAVHAPEDPILLNYLAKHQIGVESNLTSNVQTSTVKDYPSHPLKLFLEHGILATINSDDPGISAHFLRSEYEHAAPAAGLSPELIHQAQRNALETAFLSKEEKNGLLFEKHSNLQK
jgi:adenosine deaminase